MSEPKLNPEFIKPSLQAIPNLNRFKYNAMATIFEILICHKDARYAEQAAWAAFSELESLEKALSRYIENSDISRINAGKMNQPLKLGLNTFECLELAQQAYRETNGAFDVTIGSLFDCWIDKDRNLRYPLSEEIDAARRRTGMHLLKLDPSEHTVRVPADSVKVDLGGIGKGFAVDKMAELLKEWEIESALVHGGASSAIALAAPPEKKGWPITMSSPWNPQRKLGSLHLTRRAINASGLLKGRHIIDPRLGRPVAGNLAAWSSTPTAGIGDALSTAFMIMSPAEIEDYCSRHADTGAFVAIAEDGGEKEEILRFGNWEDLR
jgi:thiamine biosynthesis lipoprotein